MTFTKQNAKKVWSTKPEMPTFLELRTTAQKIKRKT